MNAGKSEEETKSLEDLISTMFANKLLKTPVKSPMRTPKRVPTKQVPPEFAQVIKTYSKKEWTYYTNVSGVKVSTAEFRPYTFDLDRI
jgi:hypothetical protein